MWVITVTELARNLRKILDRLVKEKEEIIIERNKQQIARIIPIPPHQTALEAMADLYRTLPEDAGEGWEKDAKKITSQKLDEEIRDPWDT